MAQAAVQRGPRVRSTVYPPAGAILAAWGRSRPNQGDRERAAMKTRPRRSQETAPPSSEAVATPAKGCRAPAGRGCGGSACLKGVHCAPPAPPGTAPPLNRAVAAPAWQGDRAAPNKGCGGPESRQSLAPELSALRQRLRWPRRPRTELWRRLRHRATAPRRTKAVAGRRAGSAEVMQQTAPPTIGAVAVPASWGDRAAPAEGCGG